MSAHVSERLSAYLDGELEASARTIVDEHVGACEACARELAALAAVDGLARELPPDEAPPGYFDAFPGRVRRRLEGRAQARVWRWPAWTWAAAAAALIAVIAPLVLRQAQVAPAKTPVLEQAEPPAAKATPSEGTAAGMPAGARARTSPAPAPLQLAPAPTAPAPALPRVVPRAAPQGFAEAPAPTRNEASSPEAARDAAAPDASAGALAASPARRPEADSLLEKGPPRAESDRAGRVTAGGTAQSKAAEETAPSEESRMREALPLAKARTEPPADEEGGYRALVARPARTLAEARGLREAWRAFSLRFPKGPHADEARVRVVETGATAWRVGRDPADLAQARADAAAYLARPDAAQAARMRAALEGLER